MTAVKRPLGVLFALSFALLIVLTPAGRAAAVEVVDSAATSIDIEIHKGSLVRLPEPATTVFIADPEIADIQVKSPTLIYVFGKKAGETTLYAVGAGDDILANLGIRVNHNLGRLREVMAESMLDAEVEVASVAGTLVVSGVAHSAAAAEEVRRLAAQFVGADDGFLMRVGIDAPNQVNLRVRIAEVSRSAIKQFGINWDAVFSSGNFLIGLATGNPVLAGAAFATRENNNNNLFGSFSTGRFDINGLVDALADEGLLSVLAEPNLTALSGETASFLAGGEFPIPVPQDADTITVQFKKFGVQLAFTPVLLDNDRISLRVSPEVSQLTSAGAVEFNAFSIPALTTRRADTMVELASGQSFAIAGLLQNNLDHDVSKFPGLGDLPVIGSLFRSDTFRRDESELVIIITPYIVQPVSERTLATPVDGMVPANDLDRILGGSNSGLPDTVGLGPEGARLEGSVGFILD